MNTIIFISAIAVVVVLYIIAGIFIAKGMKVQRDAVTAILKTLIATHERDKLNLVAALKSHTAEDFAENSVLPPIEDDREMEPADNFQDIQDFARENPEKFDEVLIEADKPLTNATTK